VPGVAFRLQRATALPHERVFELLSRFHALARALVVIGGRVLDTTGRRSFLLILLARGFVRAPVASEGPGGDELEAAQIQTVQDGALGLSALGAESVLSLTDYDRRSSSSARIVDRCSSRGRIVDWMLLLWLLLGSWKNGDKILVNLGIGILLARRHNGIGVRVLAFRGKRIPVRFRGSGAFRHHRAFIRNTQKSIMPRLELGRGRETARRSSLRLLGWKREEER